MKKFNIKSHQKTFANAALFTAALIWGSSFFIVKDLCERLPANFLLALRFTIGGLVLAVIFHRRLKKINRDYLLCTALLGFSLFLGYVGQTIGVTDTTPGKNAFLTSVYCIIVPFLFWVVKKTKPDWYNIAAAAICLFGIGMVSMTEGFSLRFGDLLSLLGGFFYAVHIVLMAIIAKDRDPILLSILQFGFTAVFSWIATLLFETPPELLWEPAVIGAVLYLAIGCTAIALLLQNIGQKYTHPAAASIILSLESVFGVFFSVLFYGETLTVQLIFGFLMIFIAILISETKLSILSRVKKADSKIDCKADN